MEYISILLWITSVVAGFIGVLYLYFSHNYKYWKKRGVHHPEPSFPAGNVPDLMLATKSVGIIYEDLYKQFEGHKFAGFYQFHSPQLLLRDPDLIKTIMVKDFEHFHDHGFHFDEKIDPLGANLFQLDGEKWKNVRNKLSPTFTSGKIKMMFHTVVECTKELEECLSEHAKVGKVINVKDEMQNFTMDVIASAAFGLKLNCMKNPDTEFKYYATKALSPSFAQKIRDTLYLTVPSLPISLGIPNIPRDVTNYFLKVVGETVEQREKNNIRRNDFMELLIQLKNKGTVDEEPNAKKKVFDTLTTSEVAAHAFTFFLAGFETSATTISFTLYELALNPDVQDRLRSEIDDVLKKHDGQITYDAVQEMSYLDKVVSETLRKHPPAPFHFRECTKDYKIPGTDVVIETGTQVVVPVFGLHYDPKYFPDPEKYDPGRFNEDVKSKRHNYVYLPFGEGPRICIGMRFALVQVKVGLVSLLSKFEFHKCSKTVSPPVYDAKTFILFMEGGTWLQIKNRSR